MAEGPESPTQRADTNPSNTHPVSESNMEPEKKDISHVERVLSAADDLKKGDIDFSRMDKEVQEYAMRGQVDVDEATSKRLRRMIDRRVLVIMIITYFLQALDKGTLSFSSIMGLREEFGLIGDKGGQQVCLPSTFNRDILIYETVFLADDMYLHRCANCRVSHQLDYPARPHCEIPWYQYLSLGCGVGPSRRLQELCQSRHCPYFTWYF